jgi:hypothetical protein
MNEAPVQSKRNARRWLIGLLVVLIVLAAVYVAASVMIGRGVRFVSDAALGYFPERAGDRIGALMALVESDQHGIRDRNRAIWALGQLGDPRALPVLEKHYTGGDTEEPGTLSQYEVKKAIALCNGATNISALVWRRAMIDRYDGTRERMQADQ